MTQPTRQLTAEPPIVSRPTAPQIPQYSVVQIIWIWAGAAVPMGLLAWVAAPRLARSLEGPAPLVQDLFITMTVGLVWQFVMVQSPRSPGNGRVGGRVWLVLIPLMVLFAAEALIPSLPYPAERDLGAFLGSEAGEAFFNGAWGWFGLLLVIVVLAVGLGCLRFAPEPTMQLPDGAQAGDLTLEPCDYDGLDADCGTIVVPENRADPDSRLIVLPVTRIRAGVRTSLDALQTSTLVNAS